MRRMLVVLAACSSSPSTPVPAVDATTAPDVPAAIAPLHVTSLGVQGFALRLGDEVVMTAPMFTWQSAFLVGLDAPLDIDTEAVDTGLAGVPLDKLRAVVSGHAHSDHLLDVPYILGKAPGASLYANRTAKHIFAALAPDRPARCTSPGPLSIARARVVAMDEPNASYVDWANCPSLKPGGAPLEVTAPGGRVRVKAFCAMHPDQIGPEGLFFTRLARRTCEMPRDQVSELGNGA